MHAAAAFSWILLACKFMQAVSTDDDKKDMKPNAVTTTVGQSVNISCQTTVERNVQWVYFNDSSTLIEQIVANDGQVFQEYAHRYDVIGDKHDYTLVIKRTEPNDTGIYGCLEDVGIGKLHTTCLCVLNNDTAVIQEISKSRDECCARADVLQCVTVVTGVVIIILISITIVLIVFLYRLYVKKSAREGNQEASAPGTTEKQTSIEENGTRQEEHEGEGNHEASTYGTAEEQTLIAKNGVNQEGHEAAGKGSTKLENVKTVVPPVDSADPCSRIFTVLGDFVYVVCEKEMKILVYNINDTTADPRNTDKDIPISELEKPCCFTASYDKRSLYLGDRGRQAVFKISVDKSKKVESWLENVTGQVQSIASLKNGVVLLVTTKYLEDKFWSGKLEIYNYERARRIIKVPAQYLLPYCVEPIDDENFAVSYGLANLSGVAIFNEGQTNVAVLQNDENLWCPCNIWYDREQMNLIVTDAGTKQVMLMKLVQSGATWEIETPEVIFGWEPKKLDFHTTTKRPLRVAYDGPERVFISLQNGKIDLYKFIDTSETT